MDFETYFASMVELFAPLHRKGPGSDEFSRTVRDAIDLPADATIADMGCGTGAASFVLAERFSGQITALDLASDYTAEVNRQAREQGISNVTAITGNMDEPPFPQASLDCIWADCSIYVSGFAQSLQNWKPLLKRRGLIVASDVIWKTAAPSPECHAFWAEEYPDMSTAAARNHLAEVAGYQVEQVFDMPRECWWESFYQPLVLRMDEVEAEGNLSEAMAEVISSTRREVAIFEKYEHEYGSAFFVIRRVD